MTDTAPAATDVKYEQVDLRVGGVGLTVAAVGRSVGTATRPRSFSCTASARRRRTTSTSHASARGVELAEIPHCGHWPMYANPVAMWERIVAFIHPGQAR